MCALVSLCQTFCYICVLFVFIFFSIPTFFFLLEKKKIQSWVGREVEKYLTSIGLGGKHDKNIMCESFTKNIERNGSGYKCQCLTQYPHFPTEFSILIITLLGIWGSCQGQHILLRKLESILGIVSPVDKVNLIIEWVFFKFIDNFTRI